jgi:hypothetical protein
MKTDVSDLPHIHKTMELCCSEGNHNYSSFKYKLKIYFKIYRFAERLKSWAEKGVSIQQMAARTRIDIKFSRR